MHPKRRACLDALSRRYDGNPCPPTVVPVLETEDVPLQSNAQRIKYWRAKRHATQLASGLWRIPKESIDAT